MRTLVGRRSSLILALLTLGSCRSDPSAPNAVTSGPLRVSARASVDSLVLTNRGDRSVGTFVVGRERAPLIFWGPCADPAWCPALRGGERSTVPYPPPMAEGQREEEALV